MRENTPRLRYPSGHRPAIATSYAPKPHNGNPTIEPSRKSVRPCDRSTNHTHPIQGAIPPSSYDAAFAVDHAAPAAPSHRRGLRTLTRCCAWHTMDGTTLAWAWIPRLSDGACSEVRSCFGEPI